MAKQLHGVATRLEHAVPKQFGWGSGPQSSAYFESCQSGLLEQIGNL